MVDNQKIADILKQRKAEIQQRQAATGAAAPATSDAPATPAAKSVPTAAKAAVAKAAAAKAAAAATVKTAAEKTAADKQSKAEKPKVLLTNPKGRKFVKLSEVKYLKLSKAQLQEMAKISIRKDTFARDLKRGEAWDELSAAMSSKVMSLDDIFDLARKYGVSDADIKKYKKTPNPGLCRMSLGIRLRHLIVAANAAKESK